MDEINIKEIEDFLVENEIAFKLEGDIFYLLEGKLQLRYANAVAIKIGYLKRFGYDGVNKNYCFDITMKLRKEGIRVIWIKDFEMADARKWRVIKSYILSACGKVKNRIYARDCEVRVISNKEARKFLEENSFYGYRSASVTYALFLKKDKGDLKKGDMLMLISFGHAFFGKGKYEAECIRSSTLANTQVIGGSSKLMKRFIEEPFFISGGKEIHWKKFVFYLDADHNSGNSMETLGYEFIDAKSGFMNVEVATGKVTQRKPLEHAAIMLRQAKGEIVSTPTAGVRTYIYDRSKDETENA
jgi:hypothetical protein